MTGLGDLGGGIFDSAARGVSADGSVVVGYGTSASGQEAFRWSGGLMTGLGDLPGGSFASGAQAVSADGNVVVGSSTSDNGPEAFVWRQTTGMQSLVSLLLAQGINPSADNWGTLLQATAVSFDGRYVVGHGIRGGTTEAFLADLGEQPVPEPSTYAAVVTLAGLVAWQRWRKISCRAA